MKTTDAQDAEMMAAPLTAADLVNIAGNLIDSQDKDDDPDRDQLMVRAGIKAGIASMCVAATSALNSCGINAQVAGLALADHHGDAQLNQGVTTQSGGIDHQPTLAQVATPQPCENLIHRAMFTLPPIQLSAATDLAVPTLPVQRIITGDKEVDAVIWLREVIGTGQPALIEKAKEAAARITTPLNQLEKRYSGYLARKDPGFFMATLPAMGFADLDGWQERSIALAARRQEAQSRFGDALFDSTLAESFAEAILADVTVECNEFGIDDLDKADVDARFNAAAAQRPATLSDCLAELKYWTGLYWLRNAIDPNCMDFSPQAQARKDYAFRCLASIPPRSTEEAHKVLQFLYDDGAMDWQETPSILRNLMTQASASNKDCAHQKKWAELSAQAPKVPVDDIADVLALLRIVADQVYDADPAAVCRRAIGIIEGLLPHAGAGVEA